MYNMIIKKKKKNLDQGTALAKAYEVTEKTRLENGLPGWNAGMCGCIILQTFLNMGRNHLNAEPS